MLDEAALALALIDHPEAELESCHRLLAEIEVRLRSVGADAMTSHVRADALSLVLNEEFGFIGDQDTYEDPVNADLIRVLDRRRGLPISLSILYVSAARRRGGSAGPPT